MGAWQIPWLMLPCCPKNVAEDLYVLMGPCGAWRVRHGSSVRDGLSPERTYWPWLVAHSIASSTSVMAGRPRDLDSWVQDVLSTLVQLGPHQAGQVHTPWCLESVWVWDQGTYHAWGWAG